MSQACTSTATASSPTIPRPTEVRAEAVAMEQFTFLLRVRRAEAVARESFPF